MKKAKAKITQEPRCEKMLRIYDKSIKSGDVREFFKFVTESLTKKEKRIFNYTCGLFYESDCKFCKENEERNTESNDLCNWMSDKGIWCPQVVNAVSQYLEADYLG